MKNIKVIVGFILNFTFILSSLLLFSFNQSEGEFDLNDLIEFSLSNNLELAQIELDIKKAEFDLQIAKAKKFPSISFSVSLSYLTNPIGPISLTAGQLGSIPSSGGDILIPPQDMIIFKGMENTLYQFKLTIDQPLFTWSKIDKAIEVYNLLLISSRLKKLDKINQIKTKIKIYYYSLFYLEKIQKTMEQQKSIIDRLVTISKQSYDNGFITYSEYLQSVVSQKEFEYNYKNVESEKQRLINDLKDLLNYLTQNQLKINYDNFNDIIAEDKLNFQKLPENIFSLALENNIQLKQLDIFKKIVEKQYEIILASGYFKPDIGLRIEISYYGPRFPFLETGWFTANDYNITFSLGLSAPIFDAGSLEAKIQQAKNEISKIFVQIEYAYQNIKSIIESKKLKIEVNKAKLEYLKAKINVDKETLKLKEQAFLDGELQEFEFLKYKLNLFSDQISLYLEAIDYFTNYYSLEILAGVEF